MVLTGRCRKSSFPYATVLKITFRRQRLMKGTESDFHSTVLELVTGIAWRERYHRPARRGL